MARSKSTDKDLVARLRASGLRKKVAHNVAAAVHGARSRKQPPKEVARVISGLRSVAGELQDRATGGASKRSEAAKKAAATRKRKAANRSTAAKKGARTRAKKS
ncbi:MAG: hypothetical protein M3P44_14755 [Actinomycetota bacterium]|nr:hypothetical protein [Actinomycetota bacterium]